MPNNIPTRGATSNAQELRSFISQQAASNKQKDKQARFDDSSKEIYRKSSGTTWGWGRNDSSKKARHKKIDGLKTQLLQKFGPSYHSAIKSAFARQQTVALKDGTRVYKTAPTFAQLEHAIQKGDKQVVQDKIDAQKQEVANYSKFLTPSETRQLNTRIKQAIDALGNGDLERAKLDLNGENELFAHGSRTSESILAGAKTKAKRAATEQYRTLKFRSRELFHECKVSNSDKQKIKGQLAKAKSFIETGHPDKALKALNENLPGTSRRLGGLIGHLKSNGVPKNFPNGWHTQAAQSKVAQMNKQLVFGGDDGDCFYGAVALQLGIPMTQVRQDVNAQAKIALQNNRGNDLIFGEIAYNDLKEDVEQGIISQPGNAGDYLYAQLVADKYERPVTMIDKEGNTRTFSPLNNNGQPALVMAFNGGHFDAVVDKQPRVPPQSNNSSNNNQSDVTHLQV